MRRYRFIFVAALALVIALGAAIPALAAGAPPPYFNSGGLTLIYTASSGGQPQGAFIGGRYVRLATPDCPAPAVMRIDGADVYVCPPPIKLPPFPPR